MVETLIDSLRHIMDPSSMKTLMAQYEERPEQRQMAEEVLRALQEHYVTLIEAGTGTGKSLAYLLPALLFASERGEQVIIATNTITLQEQLLHKDIPIALKLLKRDLHVVLAKGMGNYICMEKLKRQNSERSVVLKNTTEEDRLCSWASTTATGSRSDLPFRVSNECWDTVAADIDTCSTCHCQNSSSCFFLAARRELHDAHLILTNHHLLFADLVRRVESSNRDEMCILPPLKRLIIDEAHHLEDVATDFFAKRSNRSEFAKLLSPFFSDTLDKRGARVRNLFTGSKKQGDRKSCIATLEDLSLKGRQAQMAIDELFYAVDSFADQELPAAVFDSDLSQKLRLKESHFSRPVFQDIKKELMPKAEDSVLTFCAVWRDAVSSLSVSNNEKKRAVKLEFDLACQRLSSAMTALRQFFMTCGSDGVVHWMERQSKDGCLNLVQAAFDLSSTLREHLFSPAKTTVLCSATLSTGKNFDFCQSRLGLINPHIDRSVRGVIYPSPFDYEKHVLFGIPIDISAPDTREYAEQLPMYCAKLIETSGGGTLILFTSHASMQMTFERTQGILGTAPFSLLKQGDQSRRLTIDAFRSVNNAVLFATASFWEGIDVPGSSLRSVIIAKLPFDVPSEPLAEARAEALKKRGENPFSKYSLPRACVRFKQAFGRLIRRKDDRGSVVCLDNRLLTKPYGKVFLNSLPSCPVVKANFADLTRSLKDFFEKPPA
jgi:ATP-dependent DNA helicase DinG